jgi:tripartite-type tricarboxylate transporter receptor subunit TctC
MGGRINGRHFLSAAIAAAVGGFVAAVGGADAHADSASDFYAGKHITLIVPTSAGGGYDVPARALARHISEHIPGHPSIVVQNMPGAGGKRAINYVYNVAPRDGSVISAVHAFIAFDPLFEGAASKAQFDALKFNWLGSITSTTSVGVAWHAAKVKTYKDLYTTELTVGGVGTTTPMVTNPTLLKGLLGMKFNVVIGYLSGSDVDLAMERGEVEGRIDYTWFGLKQAHPDWLRDKKINILFQMGLHKAPDLPDVPLALDFARNDEERRILETVFLNYEFGRPYMTTPVLPPERLAALRKAFMDTMKDPGFVVDAHKAQLDVDPVAPERLAELVKRAYALPPSLVARINALQQPSGEVTKVQFKTVRAKLGEPGKKGRFPIALLDGGTKETVMISDRSKVSIAGKKAEVSALKPGMTCAISYLGDGTVAASVSCD